MMEWPGCSVCLCICICAGMRACVCERAYQLWALGGGGAGCGEMGEPCHVFMLTNELITQPLIYLNLCHFTGMPQQSNACRLWVISWQLKANYCSSNSSAHQALNHKCCSLSICLYCHKKTRLQVQNLRTSRPFAFMSRTIECVCLRTYPPLSSLLGMCQPAVSSFVQVKHVINLGVILSTLVRAR